MTSARSTTPTRSTPARLARLHLRTGSLSLARAELETLAGHEALDDEALIDLAEVRWRTGDLAGAGDAARAYLETGHESTVALAIAAEAADALGRAAEAHRLVARALEHPDVPLDEVFAGLPRSTIWPGEAHRAVQGPLFASGLATGPAHAGEALDDAAEAADEEAIAAVAASAWTGRGLRGLWDEERTGPGALPSGRELLDDGRTSIAEGRIDEGLVRLAVAVRLQAELAPLVLDAIADQDGPVVDLLRGDALRLAGSEGRARGAWAAALSPGADAVPVDAGVTDAAAGRHHRRPDDQTTPPRAEDHGPGDDPEEIT